MARKSFIMPDELDTELRRHLTKDGIYTQGAMTRFLVAAAEEKLRRDKKRGERGKKASQ